MPGLRPTGKPSFASETFVLAGKVSLQTKGPGMQAADAHGMAIDAVVAQYKSDPDRGLTESQVRKRCRKRPHELSEKPRAGFLALLWEQFNQLLSHPDLAARSRSRSRGGRRDRHPVHRGSSTRHGDGSGTKANRHGALEKARRAESRSARRPSDPSPRATGAGTSSLGSGQLRPADCAW